MKQIVLEMQCFVNPLKRFEEFGSHLSKFSVKICLCYTTNISFLWLFGKIEKCSVHFLSPHFLVNHNFLENHVSSHRFEPNCNSLNGQINMQLHKENSSNSNESKMVDLAQTVNGAILTGPKYLYVNIVGPTSRRSVYADLS